MKSKESPIKAPIREDMKVIREKSKIISDLPYTAKILNSFPDIVVVINKYRQVIFANEAFLNMFGFEDFEDAMGNRPGELIKCIYSHENESGCGFAKNCRYCGAILTVLKSQETGQAQKGEARITVEYENQLIQLDLNIIANPLIVDSIEYTVVFMSDISNQKRREYLERTFIHDIINSTWALSNRLDFFPQEGFDQTQMSHFIKIKTEIERLMEEIEAQRDIIKIENKEFTPDFTKISSMEIVKSSIETISTDISVANKTITIDSTSQAIDFQTDERLIRRVLINLLKNALEASKENEEVKIGCKKHNNKVLFWVQNNAIMSEEIKSQIFQRFFSTKGPGRGLGTYSVKILVEEYLNGKVSFESNKKKGTIFKVILNPSVE